jgi:hypothetical protein
VIGGTAHLAALVLVGLRDPVWQAFEHYPRRSPFGRATSQYHDRVETRWGLNAHAAWPFVEPFFNEHERELDVDGRSDVHFFLNCCLGAVVIAAGLAVDSFVSPVLDPPFMSITLALAAFAAAMLAYLGAVRAVRGWGEFKEAAIVLHRFELHDRLGLERPRSVDEERGTARRSTGCSVRQTPVRVRPAPERSPLPLHNLGTPTVASP